jgi:hypothetical protein
MSWIDYEEYIQSDEWKRKDKEFVRIMKKCQDCGSTERLGSHHKTYKNLGDETLEDVDVLCWNCHIKRHKYSQHRKLNPPIKEVVKKFEQGCIWRETLHTLPEEIKVRFEIKEDMPKIQEPISNIVKVKEEVISTINKSKFKVKMKDDKKQIYYDEKEKKFKTHTYLTWLQKIVEVLKKISKPFRHSKSLN